MEMHQNHVSAFAPNLNISKHLFAPSVWSQTRVQFDAQSTYAENGFIRDQTAVFWIGLYLTDFGFASTPPVFIPTFW